MNNDLMFATGENDVETPDAFFTEWNQNAINATGSPFVWDVAAVQGNRKVADYFGPDHKNPAWRNCLTIDWPKHGPLRLNPPYGKPENACKAQCEKKGCVKRGYHLTEYSPGCIDFVKKAYEECLKGCDVWMLLASRTDNEWWHSYVGKAGLGWSHNPWKGWVNFVEFIQGRLVFKGRKDAAPFPSVMVRFKL
jgi:hypothetical protein